MAEDAKKAAAPYLPFKTFLSAMDAFTAHGLPPLIDRSIWRTQPGGVQGLIMGALRFFDLMDDENRPTELLQGFVSSPAEKRTAAVRTLLEHGYAELIRQDLTKMTVKMLDGAIEMYGVSGETKKKATTFFLQAAKFSDLPLSSFLQTQIRATPGTRRKRSSNNGRNRDGGDEQEGFSPEAPTSRGSTKTIELHNGGTLTLNVSVDVFAMSSADRDFVFDLIDRLRGYESRKSSAQAPALKESK